MQVSENFHTNQHGKKAMSVSLKAKKLESKNKPEILPEIEAQEGALGKTKALIRTTVSINDLLPNTQNPNEMSEAEFNMLYDNVERMGVTDPILVRAHPEQEGKYRIVGGHHRWEVAKLHGLEEIPVTIITDPSFDDDMEKFQMVRHNVIRGRMTPQKFMGLYQSLQGKYEQELAAELFGFSSEEEFKKLILSTANSLPPEMKQTFLDASKDLKTIDDLSLVLNRLFTTYGDTVPYGYMIFDYGGEDHIWLRMDKKQKDDFIEFGQYCVNKNRTIDKAFTVLLQLAAQGKLSQEAFESGLMKHPEITIAASIQEDALLTEDYLASLG